MTASRFGRIALSSLAFTAASLALAPGAGAGSRLLEETNEVFAQEAPDPGYGAPATRRTEERRQANSGDWFRAPLQAGSEDFPAREVHDAVVANTRAAIARAMFRRAESTLNATFRDAQRQFEQSAELRGALAGERRAWEALQEARSDALRDVITDPKYQAMQDLRDNLTQKIADRREGTAVTVSYPEAKLIVLEPPIPYRDDADVVAIATLKMRVNRDARAMEREALAGNDRVRQAREDLARASARVSELRGNFERSLRDNDDLKQARDDLEEARVARLAAETYFLGANHAAGLALDFSYYVHRYDYNRYPRYGYGLDLYPRYGYPYYGGNYMRQR
jgi:hypothetical protein